MSQKNIKLDNYWNLSKEELVIKYETTLDGLSSKEAVSRLASTGYNQIIKKKLLPSAVLIFINQLKNWLIIILIIASLISFFLGEHIDSIIIISIVFLSVIFGFIQEYKAEKTLEKLKKFVSQRCQVKRDGKWQNIDTRNLVPGDVVKVQIGSIVPADMRLITVDDLSANESILTGESLPVEKHIQAISESSNLPQKLTNTIFMGASITSGYGDALVVATGNNTFLGRTAAFLEEAIEETDFQKQTSKFSLFLFRIILAMTGLVFVANSLLGKGIFNSFFFSIALAVGITPELLPAIMTVTLSQGAMKMAKKKVVVKKLAAVEDLGNIDTLCIDKTGTITNGTFALDNFVNTKGEKEPLVFIKALLCTNNYIYGKSFTNVNPTDQAIWDSPELHHYQKELSKYEFIDKNEFDYARRRMSVLVKQNHDTLLIVKGAPESMQTVINFSKDEEKNYLDRLNQYEKDGFRVITIAEKKFDKSTSSKTDEKGLTFLGFLLLNDPIKTDAKKSLDLFQNLGIEIKILSGDSLVVTRRVINQIGLKSANNDIISGDELDKLSESEIQKFAHQYNFFARITPEHKYRLVNALNKEGHIVGFLGDGVNDAPALKAADVGIAVDTSASIAKEAADIILMRKDLSVLAGGIEAGRKTFANILKYIMNTISANFGNMLTVALSSLFLTFIPLLPKQILLTNFISDFPLLTVATDNVDRDYTKKPKRWNIKMIGKFMLFFGLISSIFDFLLILPIAYLWKLPPDVFRTAWFIESTFSEILITFVIRTKLPMYKSMPSSLLIISSFLSGLIVVILPILNFGQKFFEFSTLPNFVWIWIIVELAFYLLITEVVKHFFFRKNEL